MSDHDEFSVDAARRAAERDELGDWVARFLASPGSDNAALATLLTEPPRWWIGPVRLPLDQLHRLAGPPGAPGAVRGRRRRLARRRRRPGGARSRTGWEPPPVIVTYRDDELVLEDGNHRVEGLRRAGEDQAWAVVGFEDPGERDRFVAAQPGVIARGTPNCPRQGPAIIDSARHGRRRPAASPNAGWMASQLFGARRDLVTKRCAGADGGR